ncbi:MAG: MBL fold metallo-hydrolase [Cyclobacteriaceae bacterium]|nr:MBL fold metallo-hydrolase [Cyclobacteriaceae bacterium]MCH8516666.1 MBL fold metallo-hydrolase [Cyclobacteriaceae bacterium]
MKIQQFEDKGLAHYSYALLAGDEVYLVDPARNPAPYYEFAKEHSAQIKGVIETHPHADFVSSHLEIHQTTGAKIYVSEMVGADYPHIAFDEGDVIELPEKVKLKAIHTPGHSPDGISIIVEEDGKDKAVFTGDTLFIGDVGRPDLREKAGNMQAKREELAKMMYKSRDKFMALDDDVVVYPAHGSGSLCGKALSDANSSTIGEEKQTNYALKTMTEDEFVKVLLEDQPFIPKYFPWSVGVNKAGAEDYQKSIDAVKRLDKNHTVKEGAVVIDGRTAEAFKGSHIKGAYNIQEGNKFETWLGSIVSPEEKYYLVAGDEETLESLIQKTSKIGYEKLIAGAFVYDANDGEKSPSLDLEDFKKNPDNYSIIDIRNASETAEGKFFDNAIALPLPELREKASEVANGKPLVVHCAGGYRSAAGSSILQAKLSDHEVFDLSDAVNEFQS